jgi:ribosomal protein L37E
VNQGGESGADRLVICSKTPGPSPLGRERTPYDPDVSAVTPCMQRASPQGAEGWLKTSLVLHGTPLAIAKQGMETPTICPRCGRRQEERDRRCPQCGYDFWGAAAGREQTLKNNGEPGVTGRVRRWLGAL